MTSFEKFGLPIPETIDDAIRSLDSWIETAANYATNVDYYRSQRDKFLVWALKSEQVAAAAEEIIGKGWRNLIEKEDQPHGPINLDWSPSDGVTDPDC